MPEQPADEDAEGLGILIILAGGIVLFIGQVIWDVATDLPLQVLANSVFLVLSLVAWGGIHYILREKSIELNPSRILVSELLPAATFSFAMVYYTYPAVIQFVFGSPPAYIQKGVFWSVMQVVGAIMITASTVGWVSLISD